MKQLFTLFATLLLAVPTCVGQTFDFSAVAPSGQRLYYSYDGGVGNSVKVVNPGYGEDYASPTGALVIPESVRFEDEDYVVRAIGAQAFNGCEGLTSVEMGNSITSVERAFDGCSNLIRIVFSDSVSTISSNVLVPSLKSVTFGALFVSVSEAMFIPTSNALVLDTLRYRSDLCISQLQKWSRLNKTSSNTYVPLKALIVPCGYLQDFYNAGWNQLGSLRTECSDITVAIQIESLSENPELEKGNIHRIAPGTSYSRLGDRSIVIGDTMYCERDEDVTLYYARGAFSAGDPIVDHWSDLSTGDSLRFTATNETESITLYVTSKPYATLDVNNISAPVDIYGGMGYMEYLGQYRFKDTAATIYSTGLWVAGMNGEWLHTAANRFGEDGRDYKAGPISDQHIGNVGEGFFWNHVWKVSREDIDNHLADCANGSYDASSNREIATWPGPFVDVDNDGSYTPSQGDYPLIKGDEALLTIFNDKISHRESKGNALGIDVQLMVYAFNEPYYDNENALNNTVFAEYLIINRSNNIYTDCYLGSFTDFDLGWARDDYIGTDVTRQMSYCYNGEDIDGPGTGSFSGVPPAQSCVMLKGANELGMTGSLFYNNSIQGDNGTPLKATDYYNYLQGKWQNGHHMLYGGDACRIGVIEGLECDFMYPGASDPQHIGTHGVVPIFQAEDWTEANAGNIPGDRRGVIMSGPFTFGPGERQTLHLAYVTAKANEGGAWASVELMQQGVDQVRRQYERDTTDSERSFYYIPQNGQMVGIAEAQPKQELKVYPNPTTGVVHLATTTSERLTAELYDLMGHRIGSYSIVGGEGTIDLITLPQGFYILRCNGQVHRIIKK